MSSVEKVWNCVKLCVAQTKKGTEREAKSFAIPLIPPAPFTKQKLVYKTEDGAFIPLLALAVES